MQGDLRVRNDRIVESLKLQHRKFYKMSKIKGKLFLELENNAQTY